MADEETIEGENPKPLDASGAGTNPPKNPKDSGRLMRAPEMALFARNILEKDPFFALLIRERVWMILASTPESLERSRQNLKLNTKLAAQVAKAADEDRAVILDTEESDAESPGGKSTKAVFASFELFFNAMLLGALADVYFEAAKKKNKDITREIRITAEKLIVDLGMAFAPLTAIHQTPITEEMRGMLEDLLSGNSHSADKIQAISAIGVKAERESSG